MNAALLVADRPEAVIQAGQPSAQMAAWVLPYDPDKGGSALQAAADFAKLHGFPMLTVARIIDLATASVQTFQLQSNWVPTDDPEIAPGPPAP